MSFLPLYGVLKSRNSTTVPKIGVVIDNNDPLKIGRVKATVEGMYTKESAQWIRRMSNNFLGAGKGCEFFAVPEVGSKIWLEFPFGDDSFPYYTDENPFGKFAKTGAFKENYPYEWGWAVGENFLFKMDTDKGTFLLKNGKSYVSGNIDGQTVVYGEDVVVQGTKSVLVQSNDTVTVRGDNINVRGGKVNIGGSTTVDGRVFLSHRHTNGNDGKPTGGVI